MKITRGVKFHPKRFSMVKCLITSDAMSRQGAMVHFANIDSSMEKTFGLLSGFAQDKQQQKSRLPECGCFVRSVHSSLHR